MKNLWFRTVSCGHTLFLTSIPVQNVELKTEWNCFSKRLNLIVKSLSNSSSVVINSPACVYVVLCHMLLLSNPSCALHMLFLLNIWGKEKKICFESRTSVVVFHCMGCVFLDLIYNHVKWKLLAMVEECWQNAEHLQLWKCGRLFTCSNRSF